MKKCLRIVWKTLLTVLTIIAVVIIFILGGGLGPIVKLAAPKVAKQFGAEIALDRCVILPLAGYVRVEGVRVENPLSFRVQNAKVYVDTPLAKVGKLEIDVAMRSLFTSEYVVDKVELTGLRALYAFDFGTNNIDALQQELTLPEATPTEAPVETAEGETQQPMQIPDVRLAYVHLEDNSVTIRKFVNIPVPLPPMTLTDTSSRTLKDELKECLAPVGKVVGGAGDALGSAVNVLGDGLGKTTDALGTGLNKTTDSLGTGLDATKESLSEGAKTVRENAKALGESAGEAVKSLKGLFSK